MRVGTFDFLYSSRVCECVLFEFFFLQTSNKLKQLIKSSLRYLFVSSQFLYKIEEEARLHRSGVVFYNSNNHRSLFNIHFSFYLLLLFFCWNKHLKFSLYFKSFRLLSWINAKISTSHLVLEKIKEKRRQTTYSLCSVFDYNYRGYFQQPNRSRK